MHIHSRSYSKRALALTALTPVALVVIAACSRDPAPVAKPAAKAPTAATVPTPTPPAPAAIAANRMDCMGADGIRFALDFNAADPSGFEYASSNPADRSIVCRYISSDGDATSTWQRAADGKLTVEIKETAPSGSAKFILAPDAEGWRVQVVAAPTSGQCFSTPPPNLMVLKGRPGQECSLTAQGGIAVAANAAADRQKAVCAAQRFDVGQPPTQTQDPAALFRELPGSIVGMSPARREEVLATGSQRLAQLDPGAGYLAVEREAKTFENRADAEGYIMGTFRDSSGRTVVALVTNGQIGVKQGIWRADAKGWERVGCELIDDYRVDYQYMPIAAGKALEIYDSNGQPQGRLSWNGDRFIASR